MTEARVLRSCGRVGLCLALVGLVAVAALSSPPRASAAACVSGSTSWLNAANGDFHTDTNWSNGTPSSTCDAFITVNGTYTVSMTSGAAVKSLTIGGSSGTQTLNISAASANTNLDASSGISNGANGAITLDCPSGGCAFGPGNAPAITVFASTLVNSGTITVTAAASGTGGFRGNVTNTGTIQINGNATHFGSAAPTSTLLNQGTINIATGLTLSSGGSSCGDTSVIVNNATGGQINATGTGTLNANNYTQGAGTTTGTAPVTLNCGSVGYTGSGVSSVLALGGINLSGSMSSGQSLTIRAASANTNATASGGFANGGAITLDCPGGGCAFGPGNAPTIDVAASTLTNSGTITVTAAASGSGGFRGNVTNTGTIQINGDARVQTGSGATTTFAQNAGTTTVAGGASFNVGGTTTNTLGLSGGILKGSGTITGSVNNSGGNVAPGSSPGTLTVTNNYTQGPAGSLRIAVEGTGAGQFSKLSVGANATLSGTLALLPSAGYAAAANSGDSVAFLTYGGSRSGPFTTTTVTPPLAGGKTFAAAYDDAAKRVNAVVSAAPDSDGDGVPDASDACPNQAGPASNAGCPLAAVDTTPPETVIVKGPKQKTTKRKAKFTFSSPEAGSSFECRLDKKPFKPCSSPIKVKAKPGKHSFQVRAKDAAGNVDGSPASYRWKVLKHRR